MEGEGKGGNKKTRHGYVDPTYGKAVGMDMCEFKERFIFAYIHFYII